VEQQKKANRKIKEGVVISDKMSKTVVVQIERKVRHPLYKKVIRITNAFKAHDEEELCSVGDNVRIMEVRPMSADKRWVVLEIIGKKKEHIEEEDKGMPAPVRRAHLADEKETKGDTA
jgi:small subunit ribosomal protein S17